MSEAHQPVTEKGHTGSIENQKQPPSTGFFVFAVAILAIVGLMVYVNLAYTPSGTGSNLSGAAKEAYERDQSLRLQRVGSVELQLAKAKHEPVTGEAVFHGQCFACHNPPGLPAAPHFGDASAWGPRIAKGFDTLLTHALKGFNTMTPQGGGNYSDFEIARAVVYMANSGGANFPEPAAPAPAADAGAEANK